MEYRDTNCKHLLMHNLKRFLFLGLILFFSKVLMAQSGFVQQIEMSSANAKVVVSAFKAISFKFPNQLDGQLEVNISDKLYSLMADEHFEAKDNFLMSRLFVFDDWQHELQLIGLPKDASITAYFIAIPSITLPSDIEKHEGENCDPPQIISQEIWRKGLPDPEYSRIPNEVSHQIIHHSASQNEITDYTNLVRSIYVYHTEVNGWSDIGYNYLVAPDGSVFAGRDPGDFLDQDAVLGAHFCGSNTSTMGICMLGTFSAVPPTIQAQQALEQLLLWKSAKENLNPLGQLPHPLNQNLGTIAGHRDGCATLCPGDSLFALLPTMRQNSLDQLHSCGIYPFVSESEALLQQLQLFPNPVTENEFTVKSISEILEVALYSIDGKLLKKWEVNQKEITIKTSDLKSGLVFVLEIRLVNQLVYRRKLIIWPL